MRRVASIATILALTACPPVYAAPPASAAQPAPNVNRPSSDLNFTGVALADAIEYIRDVTQANIHVNWCALKRPALAKIRWSICASARCP